MSNSAKDYLYERKGPWPQPAPEHPHGDAPAVLHLPFEEKWDWFKHVGLRYFSEIAFYWPKALAYSLQNPGVKKVTDERFSEILGDGIISKFLCPTLDAPDKSIFKDYLGELKEGESWFKSDFRPMKFVRTHDGIFVSPSVVLFKQDAHKKFHVQAIYVNETVFGPEDKEQWDLAKAFALQGAGVCTTLLKHPILHFPMDAINAITKTALPKHHVVFKLLLPHLRLALSVDNAVLHGGGTVLKGGQIYAPYPGKLGGHLDLVAAGWRGLKYDDGTYNSAYRPYSFNLGPDHEIYSPYGKFLAIYWETIYSFVSRVVKEVDQDDPLILSWARDIARWIPGFPGEDQIFKDDNLAKALTTVIQTVSVAHSADHWIYSEVNINEVPFRLRHKPPTSVTSGNISFPKLNKLMDTFKYSMCMKMFFNTYNVTSLHNVDYQFSSDNLVALNNEFLEELSVTEAKIVESGLRNYIPLGKIANSVQY